MAQLDGAHGLFPGIELDPGPWITTNQNENTAAQIAAVIANMRGSTPKR